MWGIFKLFVLFDCENDKIKYVLCVSIPFIVFLLPVSRFVWYLRSRVILIVWLAALLAITRTSITWAE